MSWSAHCDHMLTLGKVAGAVAYLRLSGPDGSKWGESGTTSLSISTNDVTTQKSSPTPSCTLGGIKYLFLKDVEGIYTYNKSGKGCAAVHKSSYSLLALAADGFKVEQCTDVLDKAVAYMGTVGYN